MRHVRAAVIATAVMAALVPVRAAAQAGAAGPEALGFTRHFVVEIVNPTPFHLENQAIVLDVAGIRAAVAADFNTYMYALFDVSRKDEYGLVISQADDLDKDRYHDQIAFVRTLPPNSTTRLLCYYTPARSWPQVITTQKAFARGAWEPGGAEAGWESDLAAFKFSRGRIGLYGKLQAGLILPKFPAAETKGHDWGQDLLGAGGSAGLGGLSVWDGAARIPLYGPGAPQAKVTVISPGPVRGLVKVEYPAVKTAAGDAAVTVYYSAFAENPYSRQDVVVTAKPGAAIVLGPGLGKLEGETFALDKAAGTLSSWGRGAGQAGQVGLAAVFAPSDLRGSNDSGADHALKLAARPGASLTFWVAGGWERGVTAPEPADAKAWARRVGGLAARLLAPVKVEFKAR
ncbi:MAG: DUF4861 family protein [Acidobacteriota bacterium]